MNDLVARALRVDGMTDKLLLAFTDCPVSLGNVCQQLHRRHSDRMVLAQLGLANLPHLL